MGAYNLPSKLSYHIFLVSFMFITIVFHLHLLTDSVLSFNLILQQLVASLFDRKILQLFMMKSGGTMAIVYQRCLVLT